MPKKAILIENIEEVAARLRRAREKNGLTQEEAALKLGAMRTTLNRWETGAVEPSLGALIQMARKYKVSIDYLLLGKEEAEPPAITFAPIRLKGLEEQPGMLRFTDAEGNYAAIPLLSDAAAAGPPAEVNERDVESWAIIYKDRNWLPHGPESYTCIRVRGKSMYPVLDNGDIVAIDHAARPKELEDLKRLNGKIVAFRVDGGVTIKWLKYDEKTQTVVGVPENKEELDYLVVLRGEEIDQGIVGQVRWWWSKR